MEIRALRYFLAAAREESMTRAAERLHVTQPTLSKTLKALEDELGKKLFTRHSFSISLTEEGREKTKPQPVSRAKQNRLQEQQFGQAVKRAYNVYREYYRLLNKWADAFAPESPDADYHPLFVFAMHKRDFVEYLLDQLLYGSAEEKADIVIRRGKEIRELEKRIDEYEPGHHE